MKEKFDFRILIIIVLCIILIIMCYFYFKEDSINIQFDRSSSTEMNLIDDETTNTSETTISGTSEVSSGLTENLELHATYDLEESYIETNQLIKSGEYILKYTNGTYLKAPFDCVITDFNIPDEGEGCTNDNYVQISSYNVLMVQLSVDETELESISLGQKANIKISAYDDKTLEGVVTNISNTASNGYFTVTVEFDNDGEVMIGMSAEVEIVTVHSQS